MKILPFKEFAALNIEEPVKFTVDAEDAVNTIQRNSKASANWSAFPVEYAIYGAKKNRLESYCRSKNIQKIYAFFSQFKHEREVFAATPSAADIQTIEGKCDLRAYTVIPDPGYFQIISDGDYYFIFLGDQEFFTAVLNLKLDQGIKEFTDCIAHYSAGRHEKPHLTKILDICNSFNSKS